jgi:hypothetical protein
MASETETASSLGAGSEGFGGHYDHPRMLGQRHSRVEQTHQSVLHDSDDGHGAALRKQLLQRARLLSRG